MHKDEEMVKGLFILVLFIVNSLTFSFIQTIGSPSIEKINHAIKTSDGGFLLVGVSNIISSNSLDVLVIKLDQNGNILWKKVYGSTKEDYGLRAFEDSGSYYILAKTKYYMDNDDGYLDTLLLKLDQNGVLQSSIFYKKLKEDIFEFIIPGFNSNEYIIVGQGNSVSFGNNYNILIHTIDQNGQILDNLNYIQSSYSSANEDVKAVLKTSDGGFIIAGIIPKNTPPYDSDIFVIKYDDTGNIAWSKIFQSGKQENNTTSYNLHEDVKLVAEISSSEYLIVGKVYYNNSNYSDILVIHLAQNGSVINYYIYCIGANNSCMETSNEEPVSLIETSSGFLLYLTTGNLIAYALGNDLSPDKNLLPPKVYTLGDKISNVILDTTEVIFIGSTPELHDIFFAKTGLDGSFTNPKCSSASLDFSADLIKISIPYQAKNFGASMDTTQGFSFENVTNAIDSNDLQQMIPLDWCKPHIVPLSKEIVIDPAYVGLTATRYLVIKNGGLSELVISEINITGKDKDMFNYKSNCGMPVMYEKTCNIEISIKLPDKNSIRTATLNIVSNDPQFQTIAINLKAIPQDPPPVPNKDVKNLKKDKKPEFTKAPSCSYYYSPIYLLLIFTISIARRLFMYK